MPRLAGSLVRYPARVTSIWFLGLIAFGTLLLASPWASRSSEHPITYLEALFTATSAICVTGLSVRSTVNDFTLFGQVAILLLIQIGGIGIMTLTTYILLQVGGRSGLRHRAVVSEAFGSSESHDVQFILRRVFQITLAIEGMGIAILWLRFLVEGRSILGSLWQATFHTISAFCNAGFALNDASLIPFQSDIVVNFVIGALIVLGGIGFPVLLDLISNFRWRKPFDWELLHIHSKVTLIGTGILIVGGFVLLLALEWDSGFKGKPFFTKLMLAMFQSITCRTAGFNSIDLNDLSNASLFVMIVLMAIGGGPASTAGGMKVSTISLLVMQAFRRFQGKGCLSFFRRTIPQAAVDRAMTSAVVFVSVAILACMFLLVSEQSGTSHRAVYGRSDPALDVIFEVISALGTVGLSTGITPSLSTFGKLLIIVLMFLGRLGPISVLSAISRVARESKVEFANEEPLIG